MSRSRRPLLLGLLCLLVVSWGTCPCVMANAFRSDESLDEAPTGKIEGVCCPHCQKRAAAPDEKPGENPEEEPSRCPSCGRGGPNRDLPPSASGDLDIPPAQEAGDLSYPEASRLTPPQVEGAAWGWEATGPPTALSPHGCPVGIVRLLA